MYIQLYYRFGLFATRYNFCQLLLALIVLLVGRSIQWTYFCISKGASTITFFECNPFLIISTLIYQISSRWLLCLRLSYSIQLSSSMMIFIIHVLLSWELSNIMHILAQCIFCSTNNLLIIKTSYFYLFSNFFKYYTIIFWKNLRIYTRNRVVNLNSLTSWAKYFI